MLLSKSRCENLVILSKLLTSFLANENICIHRHMVYSIPGPICYLKNAIWRKSKTKRDCLKILTLFFYFCLFCIFCRKKTLLWVFGPQKKFWVQKKYLCHPFFGPIIFARYFPSLLAIFGQISALENPHWTYFHVKFNARSIKSGFRAILSSYNPQNGPKPLVFIAPPRDRSSCD